MDANLHTDISKSAALFERAKSVLPGGCSRNTILRKPHPIYVERGQGCYVYDVEGVRRTDFANNIASLIHGHAHPAIVAAVSEQLQKGTAFTLGTEVEIDYAEYIRSRNPAFERIRFVNSGTEAVMASLKAARAFTGRPKIAKVEGAYHGLYDYAEASQTAKPDNWGQPERPSSVAVSRGTPQRLLDDVVVIPFNDAQRALEILDEHRDQLACVLVDLLPHRIGVVQAAEDFIQALRRWTEHNGALLIFDEVITFRSKFGGAQQWYDVQPDITALGKMIGGGFPAGAIAGSAEVMEVLNPLNGPAPFPLSGTFSANPITMIAGHTAMKLYDREAVDRLNALGDRARGSIGEAIKTADVPACVTGRGSMFRIHLSADAPENYRQAYLSPEKAALLSTFVGHLFDGGLLMVETGTGFLSTAMSEDDTDDMAAVVLIALRKMKPHL
ncbi:MULTISPECIES: aspartate aminotransferase family protein [unclassified Mesorhizobium]|uniref:aspartate aminotransferase family protein n=1 Tax=unclassified Mesorhizobium TaxID=325217 RepID=UPI0003CDF0C4|nr:MULTISPECIES: aspartate aminotransferase family protein [unclassified Mesorhizobium]ESY09259.1 glutamate-1-semialdehyde 2,1-aminomutase [Mesorhizobium sp. LNJC395A00]WJI74875.1 aspartate aminotransferase family protein [Mesorhizobium sp. C395A]